MKGEQEIKGERKSCKYIQRTCGMVCHGIAYTDTTFNILIWNLCSVWMFVSVKNVLWTNLFTCAFVFYHSFTLFRFYSSTHLLGSSFILLASKSIISKNIYTFNFYYIFFLAVCVRVEMPSVYFERRAFYLLCTKLISVSQKKTRIRCFVFVCFPFLCYVFLWWNLEFFALNFFCSGVS